MAKAVRPKERLPGQTLPETAELDLDQAFSPRVRARYVTAVPTWQGAPGELVAFSDGTTRRLYVWLDGAWRYVNLT